MNTVSDNSHQIRKMFNSIARYYDLANFIISFGQSGSWRKKMVRLIHAQKSNPGKILDLCCGPGTLTAILHRQFPDSPIVGIDFAQNMLQEVPCKDGNHFVCADALNLPIEDESLDVVTCVFGLRNLQSFEKGLTEIHRVLQQGGIFAAMEFHESKGRLLSGLFRFYFHRVLPVLGTLVSRGRDKNAYKYLSKSVTGWHDMNFMIQSFENRNFNIIATESYCLGSVGLILAKKI